MPAMQPACDALPALVTALPCCCPACPQHPSAAASPPAPAPGPALVRTVSPRPKHRYRGSTFNPPYTDMLGRHPTSKISPMPFFPRGNPGRKHPHSIDSPQKFLSKNRPEVARLGLSRGGVGAAGYGSGGPLNPWVLPLRVVAGL